MLDSQRMWTKEGREPMYKNTQQVYKNVQGWSKMYRLGQGSTKPLTSKWRQVRMANTFNKSQQRMRNEQ